MLVVEVRLVSELQAQQKLARSDRSRFAEGPRAAGPPSPLPCRRRSRFAEGPRAAEQSILVRPRSGRTLQLLLQIRLDFEVSAVGRE